MGKNVIIFGADMSSSVHVDTKDISILDEEPTQASEDTILAAEAKYYINFTQPRKIFPVKSSGSSSFLFVNATKIYQFNAKDSEIRYYTLCLGNIS